MESRIEFIESLELDLASIQAKKSLTDDKKPVDGKDEAFVDTGSLASFTSKLSGQSKEDVLNSTMLAQLHANKVADRYKDISGWYKIYMETLENIGWVISQSLNFTQFRTTSSSFKLSEVCLELIKSLVGDDEAIIKDVATMFSALEESQGGLTFFDSKSFSPKGGDSSGNFQVLACSKDQSGFVVANLLGSYVNVKSSEENYFFFNWKNEDIKFFYAKDTLILNEDVYSVVRQKVIDKLGKYATDYIHNLDI